MGRDTPFQNGIPSGGWMTGWKHSHPELSLCTSQALDVNKNERIMQGECYRLLQQFRSILCVHKYSPDCIWNCDESGLQVGKNGGDVTIAKISAI